ncbi:MAG: AAA family ATPase, partial [Lachnospiraceae bacterium]|nr:AAA family ATPase [Lachnospiraceae bacterium]
MVTKNTEILPMPIGISDFKELVARYYYVDKTLMIKEFLDSRPKVLLFTRPRRFGKTLAMDMLKTFFEISDTDTSMYFEDKLIWNCGEDYRKEQGKYPVIFVTFKDVKFSTWEQTYTAIREIIANEYMRHKELLTGDQCDEYDKVYFRKLVEGSISEVSMSRALSELSRMLNKHYGRSAVIIIDEYDTP